MIVLLPLVDLSCYFKKQAMACFLKTCPFINYKYIYKKVLELFDCIIILFFFPFCTDLLIFFLFLCVGIFSIFFLQMI